MREIRPSGLEGGAGFNPRLLPLSKPAGSSAAAVRAKRLGARNVSSALARTQRVLSHPNLGFYEIIYEIMHLTIRTPFRYKTTNQIHQEALMFEGLVSVISRRQLGYSLAFLLATTVAVRAGAPPNKVWAWGSDRYGETDVPPGLTNVVAIAAGGNHSMALKGDGTVVVWGDNTYGQTNVPGAYSQTNGSAGMHHVVSIAAGGAHCLALNSDGTVAAWGWNSDGQINVPPGLSNVKALAGCANSSLALKNDGTLVAWGGNNQGQLNIPPGLSNVAAIAGGEYTFMVVQSNGMVTMLGFPEVIPNGLTNVAAAAGGEYEFLALLNDGSVVMWDESGNVSAGPTNVSAVVGDFDNSVFLLKDGTVAVWGANANGITNVPVGLTNVTAIAGACSFHVLALAPDQTLAAAAPETLTGGQGTPASTNAVLNALVWPDSVPT